MMKMNQLQLKISILFNYDTDYKIYFGGLSNLYVIYNYKYNQDYC